MAGRNFIVKYKKNGAPKKEEKKLIGELNELVGNIRKGEHKAELDKLFAQGRLKPRTPEELNALKETLLSFNNKTMAQVQEPKTNSTTTASENTNQQQPTVQETVTEPEVKTKPLEGGSWANQFSDEVKGTGYSPTNRRVIPKEYAGKNILQEIKNTEENKTGDPNNTTIPDPNVTTEPQVQAPPPPVKKVMKDIPTLEDRIKQNQQAGGGLNNILEPKDKTTQQPVTQTNPNTSTPTPVTTTVPAPTGNMKDLPEDKKRKYAEKTAEAMLNSYGKLIRSKFNPLKNWALIDMDKVKHKALQGKLDLDITLKLGNNTKTSIFQYLNDRNHQVQTLFVLTPEAKRDIKEPLVDVLIENNFMLTPTQRLILAVGEHVGGMIQASYTFSQQNKVDMQAFERYHKERLANGIKPEPLIEQSDPANTDQQGENKVDENMDLTDKETTRAPTVKDKEKQTEKKIEKSSTSVKEYLTSQAKKESKKPSPKKPVKKKNGRR